MGGYDHIHVTNERAMDLKISAKAPKTILSHIIPRRNTEAGHKIVNLGSDVIILRMLSDIHKINSFASTIDDSSKLSALVPQGMHLRTVGSSYCSD
ncbi:hypothetical protein [Methylocaldum sp. RMAD-M]|uniref:hypothetical protein n=1 Tax=Methylocaldum sp. RMAD-M TaxID=2806557 RepID=UPI001AE5ECB5|nr:hypothetical protein [Methylocaldum sp. RMAD-M]